ncbi:MAG TPA: CRISPR-associated protein Cmr6 [Cyanobacteria bacterium UBA8803]|nr:CRISPR-associated protein Cmr6 [Cyanobacteria bacterium UBA9273]HBL61713.1 CRISPR-associated protein Cmr6 [Cyanobacteria bacterium UBA8803]
MSYNRDRNNRSPLQALNHTFFGVEETPQRALEQAAAADDTCQSLYQQLTQKTKLLANEVLTVEFPWRVRVGGTRGFRDLLLPVFHPVYGVPYIPSSSIKGVVRAWAKQHQSVNEINRLLGTLDGGVGCVQFLDAFPTGPCLSVDMANPQWHWDYNQVKYDPQPHALLSMEQPEIVIGLALTSRGTSQEDVKKVKEWLEQALAASGIGSRVSSGYGRTVLTLSTEAISRSYRFRLWTAGMYGAFAPNAENQYQGTPEFRPTAVRGMLRYWFRAIALGLYPPQQCQELEATIFGTIEPTTKKGSIRIGVEWEEEEGDRTHPHFYSGKIFLEAQDQDHLTLISRVLLLASHLGGIGRGSRRSLHWNEPYPGLRGCHWEINLSKFPLPSSRTTWPKFLQLVLDSFLTVQNPNGSPGSGNPGNPGNRYQDVLNRNARIYLVRCQELQHPEAVSDWQRNGMNSKVRGQALTLLYDNRFKGVNPQGEGNANVGGRISNNGDGSTPSYVVIKSNFPAGKSPYQTVTILGANQGNRAAFEQALPPGAIKVWPLATT